MRMKAGEEGRESRRLLLLELVQGCRVREELGPYGGNKSVVARARQQYWAVGWFSTRYRGWKRFKRCSKSSFSVFSGSLAASRSF